MTRTPPSGAGARPFTTRWRHSLRRLWMHCSKPGPTRTARAGRGSPPSALPPCTATGPSSTYLSGTGPTRRCETQAGARRTRFACASSTPPPCPEGREGHTKRARGRPRVVLHNKAFEAMSDGGNGSANQSGVARAGRSWGWEGLDLSALVCNPDDDVRLRDRLRPSAHPHPPHLPQTSELVYFPFPGGGLQGARKHYKTRPADWAS
jgi:hypothetical protein